MAKTAARAIQFPCTQCTIKELEALSLLLQTKEIEHG